MTWINRILVPLDLSPCSVAALQYAAFLGEHSGARLYVLHAVDPTLAPASDQKSASASPHADEIRALLAAASFIAAREAHVEIVQGDPAQVILEAARAQGVDLIVMGKYGDGKGGPSLAGNVTLKVAATATCGVVPVHEPATMGARFALSALAANDRLADTAAASARVVALRPPTGKGRKPRGTNKPEGQGPHARH